MKTFLVMLLLSGSAFAQMYTTVTATLQDSTGQVWANATWTAEFSKPSGSNATFLNQGHPITPNQNGTADNIGHFSVVLDDNFAVSPQGSAWKFTICPNATVAACNTIVLTITGPTDSITGQLNAVLTVPVVEASPTIVRAYNANEVRSTYGGLYVNSINNVLFQCLLQTCLNGTGWQILGSATAPGGSNGQLQYNNLGAFGGFPNAVAGSILASTGTSSLPIFQPKLAIDVRDFGVKCDGVTDDTAAIQAVFNYYGNGGPGQSTQEQIDFPAGQCKISSTLVFEGNNSLGMRLTGQSAWGADTGSTILWFGPNFGTMFLILGCNSCEIENIDFDASPSGLGAGKAQNVVWFDASNTVTPATYNISAISRTSNIVTVTTTASHAVTAGRIVKIAGSTGGATSFNGTFKVLYANDNTHISWIQTGPDESGTASTGTVTNYQSAPSNNISMTRVKSAGFRSVTSSITSISGPATGASITTSTPHFFNTGDTVIVRGVTDTTYNCAWLVTAVGTSTTATMIVLPATSCSPDNSSSSGGTVLSGSSGVRFGHVDASTPQISQFVGEHIFMQGNQLGTSINGIQADVGGNTKNFDFFDVVINGCRYGFEGLNSGNITVVGYNGSNTTPDSSPQLATIDFVNNSGQVNIMGAETEASNSRFFANTATVGDTVHLDGISYQSGGPTDDIIIRWGAQMVITNSSFVNRRASNAVPYLQCIGGNPRYDTGKCTLNSQGNFYADSLVGAPNINAGFLPFLDGSGNGWMQPGGFYSTHIVDITSTGDLGSSTNDYSNPTGTLYNYTPDTHSLTNVTFANLPGIPNGSLIYCTDCNTTCTAGSSTGRTCFRENGAWTATAASGGNVSNSGTPLNHQVAVWTNATTIQGITPGTSGNCFMSNGIGSDPSFQTCGGAGSGFPAQSGTEHSLVFNNSATLSSTSGNNYPAGLWSHLGGTFVTSSNIASTGAPPNYRSQTSGGTAGISSSVAEDAVAQQANFGIWQAYACYCEVEVGGQHIAWMVMSNQLYGSLVTANPNGVIWGFRYDGAVDTNFQAYVGTATGTFTAVDTGVAVSPIAFHGFAMNKNSLGGIDYYIDNVKVATITSGATGFPTANTPVYAITLTGLLGTSVDLSIFIQSIRWWLTY